MGTVKSTSAKKLFILHGWTYSTQKWQRFAKKITAQGFLPVFLHVPGLTAETTQVWNVNKYVEWLKKELDKETGRRRSTDKGNINEESKVVLVGHSNGGRIALAFTSKYPEKVKLLVLIDSAGIYHNELPLRLKRFVFKSFAKIGKKITSAHLLRRVLYKIIRAKDYLNAPPQLRQTMINLISVDLTPLLKTIIVPTLILWGESDRDTPLSDALLMNKSIARSRIFIINGAGHSPHFTHPEIVSQKIVDAIEGLRNNT